jgi:UDP-N-acetylmuramoylalanine--D-glutamate ligase
MTFYQPDVHLQVPGRHNQANAAAAYQVGLICNISTDIIAATLSRFNGVPYRFETIRTLNGVEYINDTTSTTPTATIVALKTCSRPPVIIVGGQDKKLPVSGLIDALNHLTKAVIFLSGSGTERIKAEVHPELVLGEYDNLESAVTAAKAHAAATDTILFSPGFTSFGMFKNEFDRGDSFNQIVRTLV